MLNKQFRFHRGSLADSLATTITVNGVEDVSQKILDTGNYHGLSDIHIEDAFIGDFRLPSNWGGGEYRVVADMDGSKVCIGFTNFKE